jgi:hypothetical protein
MQELIEGSNDNPNKDFGLDLEKYDPAIKNKYNPEINISLSKDFSLYKKQFFKDFFSRYEGIDPNRQFLEIL